jgi:excisionase family DNA binding protein
MAAKRYVTAAYAAEYLDLSVDALRKRTRAGEIPWIRFGERGVRYDLQDLDLWMRRQRIDATR